MTFSGELSFQLSEKINNLAEYEGLNEKQKAEVLELIEQHLSKQK